MYLFLLLDFFIKLIIISLVVNSDEPAFKKPQPNLKLVQEGSEEYIIAAQAHVDETELVQSILLSMQEDCKQLKFLLEASEVVEEATSRPLDFLGKLGEKLSCNRV